MEQNKILKKILPLNEVEYKEVEDNKKIVIFKNNTYQVFDKLLNPFKDWTYKEVHNFLNNVIDFIEVNNIKTIESLEDNKDSFLYEYHTRNKITYYHNIIEFFIDFIDEIEDFEEELDINKELTIIEKIKQIYYRWSFLFWNSAYDILIRYLRSEDIKESGINE